MIENILLAASVFQDLESEEVPGFDHADFWRHSLGCGLISKFVEELLTRDRKRMEMAMLAGTLHDLGKLVFAKFYHQAYVEVVEVTKRDLEYISIKETELLGVAHSTLGGHLADWWNMPAPIVDAIRWHNDPTHADHDKAMSCTVHLADVLVHKAKIGQSGNGRISEIQPNLHMSLGISQARLQEVVNDVMEQIEEEDFLAF
jgi:HD-like signal output (HDOD) protein